MVIGGGGYFVYKQYRSFRVEKERVAQEAQKQKDLEIEKLKQEVEALKNKELQIIQKTIIKEVPASRTEIDIPTIIQQWKPRIAYIHCYFYYTDGRLSHVQSGSGIAVYKLDDQTVRVITNKHVITSENTNSGNVWTPDYCTSQFSGNFQRTYSSFTENTDLRVDPDGLDMALIRIQNPNQSIRGFNLTVCWTKAKLGDKILILGYPTIGSATDITVTEGIVSGYDGEYYITSAKVEHGNSGGAALLTKDNCYLGIPTFVEVGSVESLARILDNNAFVDKFFQAH